MEIAILECGHHFLRTLEKLEVCIIYKKKKGGGGRGATIS